MKRWLLVLIALVPTAVLAQNTPAARATGTLSAEAQARLAAADTLLHLPTRRIPKGRLDVRQGILRAAYRVEARLAPRATPEATARAYLTQAATRFGLDASLEDLALVSVQQSPYSAHVTYQQTVAGVPVYNRWVKVSLNRDGQPTMVINGYAPHLVGTPFSTTPVLNAAGAAERVRNLIASSGVRTTAPELVVVPSKLPRLAWRVVAWPADTPAEWEVLLEAHSGDVLQVLNLATHAHWEMERGRIGEPEQVRRSLRNTRAPQRTVPDSPTHRLSGSQTQGSGLVFDPDPLTTANVPYGGAYVDAGDADVNVLNAERMEVVLNDITLGNDGLYRLEGPYVRVDGSSAIGGNAFAPPAEADPHGFRYGRSNDAFEAVMAYYHIDKSQRYVQSLSVGRPIQNVPLRINPHGLGDRDDSIYYPSLNAIALGDGGIDDAEDADVIWHEYGHALLQGSAPGLLVSREGQALHEGWADYWASSYSRWLAETNPSYRQDWVKVFTWDGNEFWSGRRLDQDGTYPQDFGCTGNAACNIYEDGTIWATALMEIYDVLGREVIDRLSLASHGYLSAPVTFADAAEALIQADIDLYDGAHVGVLVEILGERGYVDPSSFGPTIAHDPIVYVEQVGATVTYEVEAVPASAAIDAVTVFYRINGGAFQQLALLPQGNDRFAGSLTLPSNTSEVAYYVEATAGGVPSRLPGAAPQETFRFDVGPDTEAPQITHEAITLASVQAWPVAVVAEVEDNQGVDTVLVDFTIEALDGTPRAEGTFGLERVQDGFMGTFPVPASTLQEGDVVRYRLRAVDVSTNANEAVVPASGTFSFDIVSAGVLAFYNFETQQALAASGVWAQGEPTFGLQVAHSGTQVWATSPGGTYPNSEHRASLDLPPFNLSGLAEVYLVFWHWYDFENSGDPGQVQPETPTTEALWDGGNVKVSTNDGATWTVVEPEGGYPGVIESGTDNPLGGEPGFGGYSFGWRRVVVPLPTVDGVRIRFDFGSDSSNGLTSLFYAGWYLDDVRVTTVLRDDTTPPTVTDLPPEVVTIDDGTVPPPLAIAAMDDTGVASVLFEYEVLRSDGGGEQTSERLAMSLADITSFVGTITTDAPLETGDRIEYRFEVRDFAGNTTHVPAAGQPPLRIEVRLTHRISALQNLRATGDWERLGATWVTSVPQAAEPVSSLVLEPIDLPENAEAITFTLSHQVQLDEGLGGNVKISTDGGRSWRVAEPEGGYGATFSASEAHPMNGQPVFSGSTGSTMQARFDLSDYGAQQLRLRLDFGTAGVIEGGHFWRIQDAMFTFSLATDEEAFEIPRELALHPNFPDPFADNTTLSYTLPEPTDVRLEIYDLLGRRVTVLVDGRQEAGTHTLTLGRGNLSSGLYLLRMMAGGTQKVEPLTIAR